MGTKIRIRIIKVVASLAIMSVVALSLSVHEAPPPPTPIPTPIPISMQVTPRPTTPATPVPTPEPTPQFYTISMAGDCTLAANHENKGSPSAFENVVGDDYKYPFANVLQYFASDDFTFVNLECVLSDYDVPKIAAFRFRAPPEYVNILLEGSVEFVSMGNNHTLDYGEQGYSDTKAILEANGIGYAGRDEWALYTLEGGLTLGIYALSFGEITDIKAGIAALKEAGADFIIAALHWGTEGVYYTDWMQQPQGHAAIDAGADFVYGCHPHVIQEIEEYKGKYIYYSFGNFSFGGNFNPRDFDTLIMQMTLKRDVDGSVSLVDRVHIPCSISSVDYTNNYQPTPYEEGSDGYERVLRKLEGAY